jgi:DNA invertase Pin-like site-specific DNA recombinase
MGPRAIAYLRVSVVGDREKRGRFESPDLQRDAIARWCDQHGVTIVREIFDRNRSGGTMTRPGIQQALQAVQDGQAEGIVVARSDRASRRALDGLQTIEELERAGGWIAAADGTIDTTDRIRKMATTMTFAMAENELERFREQSAIIHRRAVVDHGRHMGPAPLGYTRAQDDNRLMPHPEHARWIEHIFRRRADGAGWTTIARELDAANVRFPSTDGRVNPTQLARIVKRRVYLGEARHGDWVHENAHPPLIDEPLWRAANRTRPAVAAAPWIGRKHPESIMRGLVRCSGCRYVMKRLPGLHGKPPRWVCRTIAADNGATHTCPAPAKLTGREAVQVEQHVIATFMTLAGAEEWNQAHATDDDIHELQREAADAEALLDELSSLDIRRQLGAGRWSTMVTQAREAHENAMHCLAHAQLRIRPRQYTQTLPAVWELADTSERHELLCSVIQAVMIDAGTRSVAERTHVVPVWETVDLPRKGVRGFIAHPWHPPPPSSPRQDTSADAAKLG